MYTEGFIKLHRKALETSIFKRPKVFAFFVYCLMKAAWKETKIIRNGDEIKIDRGSFWTTASQDMKALKITRSERRTCLNILTRIDTLMITTSPDGTLIRVNNFDRYQDIDENRTTSTVQNPLRTDDSQRPAKKNEQRTNNQRTTNEQPTNNQRTTKEENKERKENKRIYKSELSKGGLKFMNDLKSRERVNQ